MIALRRAYDDGPHAPELVLLRYAASLDGDERKRGVLVVPSSGVQGRRETRVFLPDPPAGKRCRLRYDFSVVRAGEETFSPEYRIDVPGDDPTDDLARMEEFGGGNLGPAEGWGTFRLALPLRAGAPCGDHVRFGFGAMRKKPSAGLCRAAADCSRGAAVVEIPEALSVLKNRPMPYYLYHLPGEDAPLFVDKIACARLTFRDDAGDVASVRILWAGAGWAAPNVAEMKATRSSAPRVFEAFVYGPSGSVVEYCFLLRKGKGSGPFRAEWRNRGGGNWSVTL